MILTDTAKRIFGLLGETGMEQKEFAALVGVSPQKVSEWKSGKAKSYTKRIPQIAEALNTTTEYLLTGEGPKHKTKAVSESDTAPENRQAAAPEGSGLTEEFAKLFSTLTPENQNRIIAEMLKRQREQ